MDPQTETTKPAPQPTEQHHANLLTFLQLLLTLAPAIAAPFVPAGKGQAILAAEAPVLNAAAQAIGQLNQQQ